MVRNVHVSGVCGVCLLSSCCAAGMLVQSSALEELDAMSLELSAGGFALRLLATITSHDRPLITFSLLQISTTGISTLRLVPRSLRHVVGGLRPRCAARCTWAAARAAASPTGPRAWAQQGWTVGISCTMDTTMASATRPRS